MKHGQKNSGFTLIEMMLVVTIIIILVSMIVGIAKRIDDQGKERLCRDTIAQIGNALEQFRDFGYDYKDDKFKGLAFPLDCNGFPISGGPDFSNIWSVLHNALYSSDINAPPSINISYSAGTYDPNYSGSEVLYFVLSQVPDSRATLDKIDKSLLTNVNAVGAAIIITINFGSGNLKTLPFTRIIDPWGTPLRYDYYPDFTDYLDLHPSGTWNGYDGLMASGMKTFPVVTSAGPDKTFDTFDDISNIKQQ